MIIGDRLVQRTLDQGTMALFCPTCPVLIPYLKSYNSIPRKCPNCKTDLEDVILKSYISDQMVSNMDLVGNWAAIVDPHDIETLTGRKIAMTKTTSHIRKMRAFSAFEMAGLSTIEKMTLLIIAKEKIIPIDELERRDPRFVGSLGKLVKQKYVEILPFEDSAKKAVVIAGIIPE